MAKGYRLDERLIQLLEKDASQSSEKVARQLGVSSATVKRRLKRLIKNEVLRIVAVVDPSKVGFPLAAVIAFDVSHEKLEAVTRLLASRPEVNWVATTTGRFDVLVTARFRSTSELADFIQRELADIDGIRDTETFICLDIKKGHYIQL